MMGRVRRVENIARAGFLARGIVYMLLGYFAITTRGIAEDGTTGVMAQIYDVPGGTILLGLVAIGLAAYGFFRLYEAILNLEPSDSGWKGQATRLGKAISGVTHFVLAATAVKLAINSGNYDAAANGNDTQKEAAATVLAMPLGTVIITIVAAGFAFAAFQQAVKAWSGKFMRKMDADTPPFAETIGRVGYGARAVVFALISYTLVRAVMMESAREVRGLGGVLAQLKGFDTIYMVVAVGLLLFGIFSIVMARYRRIRDEDVIARLKNARFA